MKIAGREIGPKERPYTIAELSGNHNGSLERMHDLMMAAAGTGCSAIKVQCYTPDSITVNHEGRGFTLEEGPWQGRSLWSLYNEAHTPRSWFPYIWQWAEELNTPVFASVFDKASVDFLENGFDPPAYKVSSFDIGDIPLIKYIAQTNKPIIISTGMASDAEVIEADDALGPDYPHLFLHCVSGYPTLLRDINLGHLGHLQRLLACSVGLSDHTLRHDAAVASVALGAVAIEKHLTLSRAEGGPDAEFSLEPVEFRGLVEAVESIWAACGGVPARPEPEASSRILRKSLYVVEPCAAGTVLTESHVRAIRPSLGLPAKFYDAVLGRRVLVDLSAPTPLSWDLLAEPD